MPKESVYEQLSATIPPQKNIIEHLKARGVRDKYYVMMGGEHWGGWLW